MQIIQYWRKVHFITLIIFMCFFMQKCAGDCFYEGSTYKRNSLWSPNQCSICTCEDPVVICEDVRCSSPNCDSKKGEYLQIPAAGCCPECVRRMSPCQYESRTAPHNSVWSPDRCTVCQCNNGEVTCTNQSCPSLRCRPGEVSQVLADQCCPRCIATGRPCEYDHHVFQDASEWSPIPCTMCVCRDGQTVCYPIQCPALVCPQGNSLERRPGSCCPTCSGSLCTDGTRNYKNGEYWKRDSCTTCTCIQGDVVCKSKDCMIDAECKGDEVNITREGECCSECLPSTDACSSEIPTRYHGDIWNVTDCRFCSCKHGKVQCYDAVCEPVVCRENEMLIHKTGKCCKECVERPTCMFGGEVYHTGDSWHPDSCTLCQCGHGDIVCYSRTCPVCPDGSVAVPQPGECCGKCQETKCSTECKQCKLSDPTDCTECRLPGLFLQTGRCVQKCQDGHYPDRQNKCHDCHDSCKTCVDFTKHHCQTCKPGLLWREGQCVSRCGMGFYQQITHCYRCDTSCSMCLGPKDNQCLACSQNGLVLQSGRCVDYCSSNHFLRNRECVECPSPCKTCSSDGQSCTSCYDNMVLHRGQCLSQCPQSYFPLDRYCYPCFPSCKTCSGPNDVDCLSCTDESRLSKKGRCRMPCLDGQYRNKDGICKECGFGCGKCHSSQDGSSSVCIQCLNPLMVAFDDICMRTCPIGRYEESGICRACGSGCLRCDSINVCTSCGPNQIVSDGVCVRNCKPNQYLDFKQCKDCLDHCVECMSEEDCTQCDGQTFLLNRQCAPNCGVGYYENKKTRRCERNEKAPVIQLTGYVQVGENDIVDIPASLFNVHDPDTPTDNLVIIVANPPSNGNHIVKANMGTDVILEAGDIITMDDLRDGKIRFIHRSQDVKDSQITFKAFDKQLYSTERVLHIQVINEHAPRLIRNEHVLATVGEITPFDHTIVDIQTLDPENTMVKVLEGPLHGKFVDKERQLPLTSFPVKELHTGSIGYQLNHLVKADKDMCLIQVTDGHHVLSFIVNFELRQKENIAPLIVHNEAGNVYMGDLLQITPSILMAKSMSEGKNIIYTLVPTVNNPQYGEILMLVPIPPNGPGQGWKDMGNGKMAAKMFRFLQRDINEGRIWYRNTGSKSSSDVITFQISDSLNPPNVLKEQTLHINIMEPPLDQATPSVAPGVRLGMSVFEDQVIPISISDLSFHDPDTPDREIIYTITDPLKKGEGTLENKNFPLQPFSQFTQEDIRYNKIMYHPPRIDVGIEEKEVAFTFTVSDGRQHKDAIEYRFNIRLLPVNNMPPIFTSRKSILEVPQGGVVPVDRNVVTVSDVDTPLTEIVLSLHEAPQRGQFEKIYKNSKIVLRQGESFKYQEFIESQFQYSHDRSNFDLHDRLVLSASDGKHSTQMAVNITVLHVDQSAPILLPTAACRIYVKEGETVLIKRDDFGFMDEDDNDEDLRLTLVSPLVHGQLVYKEINIVTQGNIITQKDINSNYISYMADKEIGQELITEVLTFNVSDSNGNVLPNQILSVVIEPVDNRAPVVFIGPPLQVDEGSEVLLTTDNIRVTDQDTSLSDLLVQLEAPPKFGTLVSTKPEIKGSEKVIGVPVTSFFVQDMLDGYIHYSQSDHTNKEPVSDEFLFLVTDGINKSPMQRLRIDIMLTNDEEPLLVTEQLFVKESQAVVVTNSSVYVIDIDTSPDQLRLTLDVPPQHGLIGRRDHINEPLTRIRQIDKGASFTYQDIVDDLIVYQHNGRATYGDRMTLTVSDVDFTDTSALEVVIGLVDDETPRLSINRGLMIKAGSRIPIKSQDLRATDIDSDETKLLFTLKRDPTGGHLLLTMENRKVPVSVRGPVSSFTQTEIDQGRLEFEHSPGDITGVITFKFDVADPEGNKLIDQIFYITVQEDRIPPKLIANNEMIIQEGSDVKITTDFLSFTDEDSEPALLRYFLLTAPSLGHLELSQNPGIPISEFTQSDLAASSVCYIHTSREEIYMDSFTFSVTDGKNQVSQKFHITITPVDDEIPVVTNNGLRVQEGVRKTITEFDLKAEDKDTVESSLIFQIINPPLHGTLDYKQGDFYMPVTKFSMADIYNGLISYYHDGSETLQDNFSFTVTDGATKVFAMQSDGRRGDIMVDPEDFKIEIMPTDDGSPVLKTNLGLQFLEQTGDIAYNLITRRELEATDIDTSSKDITFVITRGPEYGRLENTANPTIAIYSFTQDDIDHQLISYVMTSQDEVTEDMFSFDLVDSKPNRVTGNMFHIMWSVVEFMWTGYNITESAGVIRVPVVKKGNLKQYSVVTCKTSPGTATSAQTVTRPGDQDYVEYSGQIQFDAWQDQKVCNIIINDDSTFEGPEKFSVQLVHPVYSLVGNTNVAVVTISDDEDKPMMQFKDLIYHVNETGGMVSAVLIRTGDLGSSVSVICSTSSLTAQGSSLTSLDSGSDFISRGQTNAYRVTFQQGVTTANCDVRIIDDSIFEGSEQFSVELSAPTYNTVIGPANKATVIINGPNDESDIHLSLSQFHFDENSGDVEVAVIRSGSDLSHDSVVWCATRMSDPPSATPGQDYIPSSSQITFSPGETIQKCRLMIVDDEADPQLEGNETFTVFLSTPMGSILSLPYVATVSIYDNSLDIPRMHFVSEEYTVDESSGLVHVPIYRSGDVSYESSVICFTRQNTAQVMMDYSERPYTEVSRITFSPGEKVKNCSVPIVDDTDYEPKELFHLRLAEPKGTELSKAELGQITMTTIFITNEEDVPRIQFKEPGYSILEPVFADVVSTLVVMVIRIGDLNHTSVVRCSTRDGSALSGLDYNAKSTILEFKPGMRSVEFTVDVIYNSDTEWHESFYVVLDEQSLRGAEFGDVTSTTVTILDDEVSGSLVLPAPPIVVSLLHYDDVETGREKNPSPGYPLICVTPCDMRYPSYPVTHSLCEKSGINQTLMLYSWEVAMPTTDESSRSPFVTITDNTVFTSVQTKILDSIYFRPNFRVRCVAQPLHRNMNPGIPSKSDEVTLSSNEGICNSPVYGRNINMYGAQSFLAKLDYVGPDDDKHPNRVHISIKIPHQDGHLPLISTHPLHNLRFVLSDPVYRQQHVCSNLITDKERTNIVDSGFLASDHMFPPAYNFPYQFDPNLRENKTIDLYRHLDLKSCMWRFDAWYHMTNLVDLCGGKVVSDFQIKDGGKTYLTIRVPLYVYYLYTMAPVGWGSLQHHTEMEFSFYYSNILWQTGLETEGEIAGDLQVLKVLIGRDGKLVIDFKTHAKFRDELNTTLSSILAIWWRSVLVAEEAGENCRPLAGMYVTDHHTLPDIHSKILSPPELPVTFDLSLVWTQQTFDSPHQLWRAKSDYNLKDYTGRYVIELVPCIVKSSQLYVSADVPCTAKPPQRFEVPIAFQQSNRPVPLVYSLDTKFELTNNKKVFLENPYIRGIEGDADYDSSFSPGEMLYGRVLWNPAQDLREAYSLSVEKVYLCTGSNGYIPTFDPLGEVYGDGPQFGCLQPSPKLQYRFLLLDKGNPDVEIHHFHNIPFNARFSTDLDNIPGVDGFFLSVDPLYKVRSGHQWFLQVIYVITKSGVSRHHFNKRSAIFAARHKRETSSSLQPDTDDNNSNKNGTNILHVPLNSDLLLKDELSPESRTNLVMYILPALLCVIVIIIIIIFVIFKRRRRKKKEDCVEMKKNNLEIARENTLLNQNRLSLRLSGSRINVNVTEVKDSIVTSSSKDRRTNVKIKNINVKTQGKIQGTEV